jgi:ribokinase
MTTPPRILICGSINMDLVIRTPHLPSPGQTQLAHSLMEVSGGKGANQAVAAARLGASVRMLGRVGSDGFGETLKRNLAAEGIEIDTVQTSPGASGIAIVAVEDSGENSILVVPGANGLLTREDIDRAYTAMVSCDWMILQLEIPIATVEYAIDVARRLGKRVILNPAPASRTLSSSALEVEVLCPNQSEAEAILGIRILDPDDAVQAAKSLAERGAKNVVITLGGNGAVAYDGLRTTRIPAHQVDAVDTTAAGDAFIGALAYQLGLGNELGDACAFAAAAAAHAVTIAGAQPSLPTLDQVRVRYAKL